MNKTIALAFVLCSVIQNGFTQESHKEAEKKVIQSDLKAGSSSEQNNQSRTYVNGNTPVTTEQTYSVDRNGVQRKYDQAYYRERLAYLDNMLDAIDTKEKHLRSLPEEDAAATENGWYERACLSKKQLAEEREEVLMKLEKITD